LLKSQHCTFVRPINKGQIRQANNKPTLVVDHLAPIDIVFFSSSLPMLQVCGLAQTFAHANKALYTCKDMFISKI
jgi:hypothetical protein